MRTIKAAEIVIDYNLYPRNNVDRHNVRSIADAIRAGAIMPPVLIDRKSKRTIDGVHRTLGVLDIDPEGTIEVIEKSYRSEADMFADAIRLNATHGAKLDSCDRVRCIMVGEKLGLSADAIAGALNITTDKLATLRADRTAKDSGGLCVPLKRTFRHMAGMKLTKRQVETNTRSSGMNLSFYVNQLIDAIEARLLDTADESLMDRLRKLHELIDEMVCVK